MAEIKPSDIYKAELKQVGAAADLDIEGPKVPVGQIVRITLMSVLDSSTVNRTMRLGYARAGSKYWLKHERAGSSGNGISMDGELYLVGGESPIARVESAPSTDECWLIVRGIYL
jgi:hypothetical protein